MTSLQTLKREIEAISKSLNSEKDWLHNSEVTQAILLVNDALINYSRSVRIDNSGNGDYYCTAALAANIELGKAIEHYNKLDSNGNLFDLKKTFTTEQQKFLASYEAVINEAVYLEML
jgi:hypothetical protein